MKRLSYNRWLLIVPALWALASASILHAQTSLTTFHNDLARDGWNQNETTLTTSNVKSGTFGKLFSDSVDGQVYAQPLYMPNVSIGGGTHNVIYIVTENDSAYALDADNAGVTYWHDSYIGGVTTTVSAGTGGVINCTQITPQIGITDTPVIDPSTNTMYFVAMTMTVSAGVTTFLQTLHAVDITTGAEKFNGPEVIQATATGTGDGGGAVTFHAEDYKERSGLVLSGGNIYTSWTSHCDEVYSGAKAYHGWIIGYSASNITQQTGVFCVTPNGSEGSIWSSGDAPSVDSNGYMYVETSNGVLDTTSPVTNYSQCFLKLSTAANAITVVDYFAPSNSVSLSGKDQDIGSAGQCLLPASWGTTAHPNLMTGADKPGDLYVVDTTTGNPMGEFSGTNNPNNCAQTVAGIGGSGYSTAAIFSNGTTNYIYWSMTGSVIKAFTFANGLYNTPLSSQTSETYAYPGCVPSVSSNGNTNGIVWAIQGGTPAVLHAYNATNLATELYNSSQVAGDSAVAAANKFTPPSIVNGKVYVPTTSSVVVYGIIATGPTATATTVPTSTFTATQTPTLTSTATSTQTRTATSTATMTVSSTFTQTATATFSQTHSPTSTSTSTATVTTTTTPTASRTSTPTSTATASTTSTPTPLPPTMTSTATSVNSSTFTETPTHTNTPVNSFTSTPSLTSTLTPLFTSTVTSTLTSTAVPPTATSTPMNSSTPSPTQTNTPVNTATSTPTFSNTPQATSSYTPTATPTHSPVFTSTPTVLNSFTPTWTISPTFTAPPTYRPTFTPSATSTYTPLPSPTPTPVITHTPSPTPPSGSTATPVTPAKPVLYPNPVSVGNSTLLQLTLGAASNVRVQIFTVSFRKVFDQTYPNLAEGIHNLSIPLVDREGTPLANGLYYVVVTVNGQRTILKLLILK